MSESGGLFGRKFSRWWTRNGMAVLQWMLLAAVVLPVLAGVVAAVIPTDAVDEAEGVDAFVRGLSTCIAGFGVGAVVLINFGLAVGFLTLLRSREVPYRLGVPFGLAGFFGLASLDLELVSAAITGQSVLGGPINGWLGLSIIGVLMGIAAVVLFLFLGWHLSRMVLQPRVWRAFRKHRLAMGSLFLLFLLVVAAFTYSMVDPEGKLYRESKLEWNLAEPGEQGLLFGGDDVGRDVAMRVWRGARVSLAVGLIASIISALLGLVVGAVAGYYGGVIDTLLMRFLDMMLSIPVIAVMVILAAVDLPAQVVKAFNMSTSTFLGLDLSIWNIVLIVVLFGWMTVARLVRGEVLKQKQEVYVEAARASGLSNIHILWGHIVPNCMGPLIVAATLSIGNIILYESALSYLGLGINPPEVSWGKMVNEGQALLDHPLISIAPGMAILLTVVSFNFLGDGLRDAFDPRHTSERGTDDAGDASDAPGSAEDA